MNEDIKQALEVLQRGGVILYPTDTVWGLGCDATNAEAVAKIYEIKRRSESKSMIVLFDCVQRVNGYLDKVPEVAYDMMELSDKPLTLILDGAKNMAHNLIADDGSVGVRVTSEEFSKQLSARFKRPIVSTSANISGEPTPTIFSEISAEIVGAVDYVVSYRQDDVTSRKPSSIIRLASNGNVKIIRE